MKCEFITKSGRVKSKGANCNIPKMTLDWIFHSGLEIVESTLRQIILYKKIVNLPRQ